MNLIRLKILAFLIFLLLLSFQSSSAGILEQVQNLAQKAGGYIKEDEDLLNLVN